jgi:hypothetical protein
MPPSRESKSKLDIHPQDGERLNRQQPYKEDHEWPAQR